MSDGLVQILDGNTFVVSDARGDIEASLHRPDRPLLVRHPVPVEVGADGRTGSGSTRSRSTTSSTSRRGSSSCRAPARSTSTPSCRSSASAPSATASTRSSRSSTTTTKPVDLTVRIEAGCDFADLFEVKDALAEEGEVLGPRRARTARARLRARDVQARDGDLGVARRRASTRTA